MALIEIRDIHKRFGEHVVFKGLILEVEEHQVVCLIGPSGCGKSTLLRCINGLETIEQGEIRIHGDRMTGPGRRRQCAAPRRRHRLPELQPVSPYDACWRT